MIQFRGRYPDHHWHDCSTNSLQSNIQKDKSDSHIAISSGIISARNGYCFGVAEIHAFCYEKGMSQNTIWLLFSKLDSKRSASLGLTIQTCWVRHSFSLGLFFAAKIDIKCTSWRANPLELSSSCWMCDGLDC